MNAQINRDGSKDYPVPVQESRALSPDFHESLAHYEHSTSVRDFLEIILRRKWCVVIVMVCLFVPVFLYNIAQEPVFKATAFVEISPDAKVTKFDDFLSNRPTKTAVDPTHIELLYSAALARRVIEKLDLSQDPFFNPWLAEGEKGTLLKTMNAIMGLRWKIEKTITNWFQPKKKGGGGPPDPALAELRQMKSMEGIFASNLEVAPRGDTSIVSVAFDSTDPVLARNVVNALIEEFVGWQMDRRIDAAGTAKQQLEKQIAVARTQLEDSESRVNQYAKEVGIVSLDSKMNVIYHQLEKINASLAQAEAERIAKSEIYDQAKNSDLGALPSVLQSNLVQNLREQYINLVSDYEKLRVHFKEDYPSVKNLKAKMLDIGRKINAEQERILSSMKNDYLAALKVETALKATAEERKAQALQLNDLASRYKILEREVDINKQIYQSLLERSKEIDANVGTDLGNIKVVDYATTPLKPYKPTIARNLFLALVLGFVGGVGLALFREHLDNTVKRVDEISDRYWIPILGVVPLVRDNEVKHLDSLVRLEPASIFSEALRFTKASIQLRSSPDNPVKTLLITSTAAGTGKSTISANLAQAFAVSEEKVLLMDVDLRRPSLHHTFGGNGDSKGLSHYLSGACTLEEIFQKTEVPNLYFVSSGPTPPNPTEYLSSTKMRKLMESLVKHFDRIILDAPPFGVFGDVLFLGHQVDGVILIVTLGQTHRDALRTFRRSFLSSNGGHLVGSVVNKFDVSGYHGGHYQEQYRHYAEAYGSRKRNYPVRR